MQDAIISNKATFFYKTILPYILIIPWIVLAFLYFGRGIFLSELFGLSSILSLAWIIVFRRLCVVRLKEDFLEIDGKKYSYEEIKGVNRSFLYRSLYQIKTKNKRHLFMPDYSSEDGFPVGYPESVDKLIRKTR